MRYAIDHDLHIHSHISLCSGDPAQTPERILRYALENGMHTVCLTDHFWDEAVPDLPSSWYKGQGLDHISAALPLPKAEGVRFLFGCETELDKNLTLGVAKEHFDLFDFIIIPTTHMHMHSFTVSDDDIKDANSRANAWVRRFDAVLSMDLPFHKVGIAHMTCSLIAADRAEYLATIEAIPESQMLRIFTRAAALGVGIELNDSFLDEEAETVLRPYFLARECGCKFYLGSDAHTVKGLEKAKAKFERMIDLLALTEEDKFEFVKNEK